MTLFNLLVKGNGWADSRDMMFGSRAFEATEPHLIDRFKPKGQFDFPALIALPALFVAETDWRGHQLVRVGSITRARMSMNDISLEYIYDTAVPPIPNSRLQEFAAELSIDRFQFSRTHWSIKDVDLYKVFLHRQLPRRQSPQVFRLTETELIEDDLVSTMMPFASSFDHVYEAIERSAEAVSMHCLRADNIWENHAVIQDIVSLIDRSKVVVCDCTGRNPNVFYEIGIAHALGREVVLITQSENDIPFDLRHLRFVSYLSNREGLEDLFVRLSKRFRTLTRPLR